MHGQGKSATMCAGRKADSELSHTGLLEGNESQSLGIGQLVGRGESSPLWGAGKETEGPK